MSTITATTPTVLIAAPTDEDRALATQIVAQIDTDFIVVWRGQEYVTLQDQTERFAQLIASHTYAAAYHDAQSIVNDYEERIAAMEVERGNAAAHIERLNLEMARLAEEQRTQEGAQ